MTDPDDGSKLLKGVGTVRRSMLPLGVTYTVYAYHKDSYHANTDAHDAAGQYASTRNVATNQFVRDANAESPDPSSPKFSLNAERK